MNKGLLLVGSIALLIALGVVFSAVNPLAFPALAGAPEVKVLPPSDSVQEIILGRGSDGHYSPQEIRVKVGTKLRIAADGNSLVGCMRAVIIQNYGSLTAGETPLEFVADKPGTFRISCPMGMITGQLVVEDSSGNVPGGSVSLPPVSGHTCGASGGGCGGCGG